MPDSVLALDVGDVRIGVAVANADIKLARPLTTLTNDEHIWDSLQQLISEHSVRQLVVGLPRGLDGQRTEQTEKVERFIGELRTHTDLPIQAQDEATTSVKAEVELRARGKPYAKSDIDALAATYILEDYLGVSSHV